ncbi:MULTISPECIES: hypothetical protein [unclassified Streptomyces]|uniref:hypothetical protein n=1 Tax=unclassified Streptomyces TaxID=2593676 RepID=UPI00366753BA
MSPGPNPHLKCLPSASTGRGIAEPPPAGPGGGAAKVVAEGVPYTHVVHDTQREAISHMDRLLKRRLPGA